MISCGRLFSSFFQSIVLPSNPFDFFRNIVVCLSLVSLLREATLYGFTNVFESIVDSYENTVDRIMYPLEPLVTSIFVWLKDVFFFDIEVNLGSYWKHTFVLLSLYFMSRVAAAYRAKRYGTAGFRFVWGMIVAFLASLSSGLLIDNANEYFSNLHIAVSAVFGVLIYELGVNIWFASFFRSWQAKIYHHQERTWWGEFAYLTLKDLKRAVVAIVICVLILSVPLPDFFVSPGLLVFSLVILIYAGFWLYNAWSLAVRERSEEEVIKAFSSNTDGIVGSSMLRSFIMASAAIMSDAILSVYLA